ncbi:hypothetical protein V6N11_036483 [Hibiscus sabdariffa]|uniref:Uncharacterized protein n=1 Tax=Hibiscus sabdariffa TaxID=183260 RepID=A0ABR2RAI9_9ROSI
MDNSLYKSDSEHLGGQKRTRLNVEEVRFVVWFCFTDRVLPELSLLRGASRHLPWMLPFCKGSRICESFPLSVPVQLLSLIAVVEDFFGKNGYSCCSRMFRFCLQLSGPVLCVLVSSDKPWCVMPLSIAGSLSIIAALSIMVLC